MEEERRVSVPLHFLAAVHTQTFDIPSLRIFPFSRVLISAFPLSSYSQPPVLQTYSPARY